MTPTSGAASRAMTVPESVESALSSARINARASASPARSRTEESRTSPDVDVGRVMTLDDTHLFVRIAQQLMNLAADFTEAGDEKGAALANQRAAECRRSAFDRGRVADNLEHCARLNAQIAGAWRLKMAAHPLTHDDGIDGETIESSPDDRALRGNAHITTLDPGDAIEARKPRTDFLAGVSSDRRGDDVPRRVGGRRAGELHRFAVGRLLDERVDLAAKSALPRAQDQSGVLLI